GGGSSLPEATEKSHDAGASPRPRRKPCQRGGITWWAPPASRSRSPMSSNRFFAAATTKRPAPWRPMVLAGVLGATIALGGCSGVEVLGDRPPSSCDFADYDLQATGRQQRIEIATFWATEAESAAFRVLARAVNSKAYVISTTDRRDRDHQQSSLKDWL